MTPLRIEAFVLCLLCANALTAQDTLVTIGSPVRNGESFSCITGVAVLPTGQIVVTIRIDRALVRIDASLLTTTGGPRAGAPTSRSRPVTLGGVRPSQTARSAESLSTSPSNGCRWT